MLQSISSKPSQNAIKAAADIAEKANSEIILLHVVKPPRQGNDYSEEEGVLHFADSVNADLIAMATHQRSGLFHLLFGSIAKGVAKQFVLCLQWGLNDILCRYELSPHSSPPAKNSRCSKFVKGMQVTAISFFLAPLPLTSFPHRAQLAACR